MQGSLLRLSENEFRRSNSNLLIPNQGDSLWQSRPSEFAIFASTLVTPWPPPHTHQPLIAVPQISPLFHSCAAHHCCFLSSSSSQRLKKADKRAKAAKQSTETCRYLSLLSFPFLSSHLIPFVSIQINRLSTAEFSSGSSRFSPGCLFEDMAKQEPTRDLFIYL